MSNKSNSLIFQSVIGLVINLISAYLFSIGLIDFTAIIIIIIGFILFIILSGFQSKINEFETNSLNQSLELKKLSEKLKIYEQLIDLKARVIVLEKGDKNGKR